LALPLAFGADEGSPTVVFFFPREQNIIDTSTSTLGPITPQRWQRGDAIGDNLAEHSSHTHRPRRSQDAHIGT
jgi:hypothetical protein